MANKQVVSIAALAALAAFTGGRAGAADAAAPNTMATAKTLQYTGVYYKADDNGTLKPDTKIAVAISRPDKLYVKLISAKLPDKPSFAVKSGKTTHEYNSFSDTYRVLDADDPSAYTVMPYIASVPLVEGEEGAPAAGNGTRVTDTVTYDGKQMVRYTDTYLPTKDHDGNTVTYQQQIYVDAKTGLYYRRVTTVLKDGASTPVLRMDFDNWKVNETIPASRFTWVQPKGSKLFFTPKVIGAGQVAPNFTVNTPEGKPVHLSDFKGKAVLIDFWATWCGPCQQSMPELERTYQALKDKGVQVIAISIGDTKKAFDKWVKANVGTKYTFPVAWSPDSDDMSMTFAAKKYKVTAIPIQFLIDAQGKIAAVLSPPNGHQRLREALSKMGIELPEDSQASAKDDAGSAKQ